MGSGQGRGGVKALAPPAATDETGGARSRGARAAGGAHKQKRPWRGDQQQNGSLYVCVGGCSGWGAEGRRVRKEVGWVGEWGNITAERIRGTIEALRLVGRSMASAVVGGYVRRGGGRAPGAAKPPPKHGGAGAAADRRGGASFVCCHCRAPGGAVPAGEKGGRGRAAGRAVLGGWVGVRMRAGLWVV